MLVDNKRVSVIYIGHIKQPLYNNSYVPRFSQMYKHRKRFIAKRIILCYGFKPNFHSLKHFTRFSKDKNENIHSRDYNC